MNKTHEENFLVNNKKFLFLQEQLHSHSLVDLNKQFYIPG